MVFLCKLWLDSSSHWRHAQLLYVASTPAFDSNLLCMQQPILTCMPCCACRACRAAWLQLKQDFQQELQKLQQEAEAQQRGKK